MRLKLEMEKVWNDKKKIVITWTTIVIDLISFTRYTYKRQKKVGLESKHEKKFPLNFKILHINHHYKWMSWDVEWEKRLTTVKEWAASW